MGRGVLDSRPSASLSLAKFGCRSLPRVTKVGVLTVSNNEQHYSAIPDLFPSIFLA